jgi:rhodanese-related sulfurtransferase
VNAEDGERQQAMVNIAKTAPIVIYCQSKGCKFAEEVAKKLITDGFNNISIFRGGWHEWEAKSND